MKTWFNQKFFIEANVYGTLYANLTAPQRLDFSNDPTNLCATIIKYYFKDKNTEAQSLSTLLKVT